MSQLNSLKDLLTSRNTADINAFVAKNTTVLDEMDENGISGLMYIGYHQLSDCLAFAIDKKKDFTVYEAAAMGLLHKVISKINSQPVLLNTPAKDGFYPLTLACFFGQGEVVNYLLKKGAKVNLPAANPTKVMPLHSAVARKDYGICKALIEHGADVNAQQTQGVTALMSAAHLGSLELVQLLVNNGADITAQMEEGKTALNYAEQDGHEEVKFFLQKGTTNQQQHTYQIFGEFALDAVADLSLQLDIELEGQALSLDLNFEDAAVSEEQLSLVNKIINSLSTYKDQTYAAILKDAEEEENVTDEYLTFHQEEGEEGALNEILAGTSSLRKRKKKLRKLLHLDRIGFYPQDEENYAIFDYTLGEEYTNYILAVVLNKQEQIVSIAMES